MAEEQALPEGFVPYTPQSQNESLPAGFEIVNKASDPEEGAVTTVTKVTEEEPDTSLAGFVRRNSQDRIDNLNMGVIGAIDLAATGVISGGAEIASGMAGLVALALNKGDVDYSVERINKWQEFLSAGPFTESGQRLIEKVAPPLSRADAAITDFAEEKSGGSPVVATAIKTLIYTGLDVAAAAAPLAKPIKDISKIRSVQRQIMRDANRLGINIKLEDFTDDVLRAAGEIGSSQRGQMAEEYVKALRNAEYVARLKKNSKYMEAGQTNLNVETSMVRKLKRKLLDPNDQGSLVFNYDLTGKEMLPVREALDLMDKNYFSPDKIATNYKRVEGFRKQLNRKISSANGEAKSALIKIKNTLDDQLTIEFNNAMIQNGRSALSGDTAALQAWVDARKLNQEWAWFKETKVIADLISKEATPEQVSTWVIGTTVSGGKKQAGMVINKIKELLGDGHPAIDAIRQDFTYELMSPLLQNEPNLRQFVKNYDTMMRNNHTVVDALGITKSDAETLRKFAQVAQHLPPEGQFYTVRELIRAFSQIAVGHEVAQGAARVKFSTKVLNALAGQDAVTKTEILRALDNVYLGEAIIPSDTAVAAGVMTGAAISGTMDEE